MRALFLAGLLTLAGAVNAATPTQRGLFLDALAAAQQGRLNTEQTTLSRLTDYPLYDYLTAADLEYRLRTTADAAALDARIQEFVGAHRDLPPARRLHAHWLSSLSRRGRWRTLLAAIGDDDSSTNRCRAVHARIELGAAPRSDALSLWRVGSSQPNACDPVFAWLKDRGLLTPEEILHRARLALLEGQYGLVRYLSRKLPDNLAARTEQWLAVAETPTSLQYSHDLDGDVVACAYKRLALRDLDAAADLYPQLVDRLGLSADQRFEMQRYVALLYAQDHQPQALAWFARLDHRRMTEHALGWEIRAAIYQQRWPLVIEAINDLPADLANDEEWRYWHARALAETGDDAAAQAIYAPLARERSYHGYLAADALGQDYSLNERPLADDANAAARVRAQPALARAYELRALGMVHASNREWQVVTENLDGPTLAQAARIAYQWQWYSRAIITLAQADYWDDLDIRYPMPYRGTVDAAADSNGLDPAYVFAIIRTESLFQPDVRSGAGAVGLMQLLPGTARHVARRAGESAPASSTLTEPSINIDLGSRYLRSMLSRWDGNLALATASYNAGPTRIARWLPDAETDPAIWIANIPYTETRNYVQRAMSHMTVFQSRLGEGIEPLDDRLDAIQPAYQQTSS